MGYDVRTDPGPDFDAGETARAVAYVTHVRNLYLSRLARERALKAPTEPYEGLLHRARPIMASTPTYLDGAVPQ